MENAEEHLAADVEKNSLDLNITCGEEALDESSESAKTSVNIAVVAKYEKEWDQLSRDACDNDLGELRRRALIGSMRSSRFRSVSWRLLLRLLPSGVEAWSTVLEAQREHYTRLLTRHLVTPHLTAEDNPLSQDDSSTWHQFFCNQELQAVIRQDVVRTFPGIDFFRERSIQEKMVAILFCYARTNPDMCYRQGMHEILAPLLFVLHSDHQALMHAREHAPVKSEIIQVLDPQNLEADAYTLFCRIMSAIESSYRISNVAPSNTGHFPYETCKEVLAKRRDSNRQENELLLQLNYIHDHLLVPKDPELAQHLTELDIPLTLFGIRWLRLLFGREFPLQDLLVLWDSIFAEFDGSKFELVDYIVVAMLIAIRNQLLSGDNTMCLTLLMRYPGAVDITNIIEHSLYLKEPDKYCRPATTSYLNLPVITVGGQTNLNRGPIQSKPSTKKPDQVTDPKQSTSKKTSPAKKSNPLSIKRFTKISGGSSKWGKQPVAAESAAENKTVVEGVPPNDPAFIMSELSKAVQVIKESQAQLSQHLAILESINIGSEPHLRHALDGIKQVSENLSSYECLVLEVEPATEAGEIKPPAQKLPPVPVVIKTKSKSVPLVSPTSDKTVNMKLFSMSEGEGTHVVGAPSEDPFIVQG